MEKILRIALVYFVGVLIGSTTAQAQQANISQACAEVQMSCTYNARYDLIDLTFKATGKVMFDKASNPYTKDMKNEVPSELPRYYIGTLEQNARLARNILANKHLFVDGKLSLTVAKRWRFVK